MPKNGLKLFQLNEHLTRLFVKIVAIIVIRQGVKRQYSHFHLFLSYLSLLAYVGLRLLLCNVLFILADNSIMEKCFFYCTQGMLPELITFAFAIFIRILGEHDVKYLNFFEFLPFLCAPHEDYLEAGNFCPTKQLFRKVAKGFICKDKYLITLIHLFFRDSDIKCLVEKDISYVSNHLPSHISNLQEGNRGSKVSSLGERLISCGKIERVLSLQMTQPQNIRQYNNLLFQITLQIFGEGFISQNTMVSWASTAKVQSMFDAYFLQCCQVQCSSICYISQKYY